MTASGLSLCPDRKSLGFRIMVVAPGLIRCSISYISISSSDLSCILPCTKNGLVYG